MRVTPLSANRPFAVSGVPIFYGWLMLPMIVLLALCSSPGQTAGLAPFYDYLIIATGLSRQAIANTYMAGTLCSGCLIPLGGKLVDRWGSRRVALCASALMSAVLLLLSKIDVFAVAVAGQITALKPGIAVIALMVPLFAMLRFSGQGLMTLCCQTTIGHWFQRRRGLAMGINGVIMSLVGSSAPLLINVLIGPEGAWRLAWVALATIAIPSIALFVWIFWRDSPEACGQHPDGLPPPPAESKRSATDGWTRGEALRTQAFWNASLTHAFLGMLITAMTFHIVDMGAGVGLSRTITLSFFIPFSITATLCGLVGGLIADRVHARVLLVPMNALLIVAILVLSRFGPGFWFMAGALSLGMATGLAGPVSIATYPRFFGRKHLGEINGAQWAAAVVASALGPSLFALLRRPGADYTVAFLVLLPIPVILGITALWLKTPQRRQSRHSPC